MGYISTLHERFACIFCRLESKISFGDVEMFAALKFKRKKINLVIITISMKKI